MGVQGLNASAAASPSIHLANGYFPGIFQTVCRSPTVNKGCLLLYSTMASTIRVGSGSNDPMVSLSSILLGRASCI